MFKGSIGFNLKFYNKNASKNEVDEALKIAQAYEVVYGTEKDPQTEGLDRDVGLKGSQLSGG